MNGSHRRVYTTDDKGHGHFGPITRFTFPYGESKLGRRVTGLTASLILSVQPYPSDYHHVIEHVYRDLWTKKPKYELRRYVAAYKSLGLSELMRDGVFRQVEEDLLAKRLKRLT